MQVVSPQPGTRFTTPGCDVDSPYEWYKKTGWSEVEAEDMDEVPGALWSRSLIDVSRVTGHPLLKRIVVAIDPSMTSSESSDEAGIVSGGLGKVGHGYLLADLSGRDSPMGWTTAAIQEYRRRGDCH